MTSWLLRFFHELTRLLLTWPQEQSQDLWSIRDKLYKDVSNDALRGLLEFNGQELVSGESKVRILEKCTEGLCFVRELGKEQLDNSTVDP